MGHTSNSIEKSSKKAWLGVNLGENCLKFLFSWRGEIANRVCFEKPLVNHVYNTNIRVAPGGAHVTILPHIDNISLLHPHCCQQKRQHFKFNEH